MQCFPFVENTGGDLCISEFHQKGDKDKHIILKTKSNLKLGFKNEANLLINVYSNLGDKEEMVDFQAAEKEENKNQVESKSEKVLGKCLEPKPKGQTDKTGVDENDKRLKSNSNCLDLGEEGSTANKILPFKTLKKSETNPKNKGQDEFEKGKDGK